MKKLMISIMWGILAPLGGCLFRLIIPAVFLAFLFCNIESGHTYGWLSGFWHGIFIPINMLRGLFFDVMYKADSYTPMYNVFWWILAASWIYTIPRLIWEGIKDTIKCYKYGPESLFRGEDY